jgi:hypothetical protein
MLGYVLYVMCVTYSGVKKSRPPSSFFINWYKIIIFWDCLYEWKIKFLVHSNSYPLPPKGVVWEYVEISNVNPHRVIQNFKVLNKIRRMVPAIGLYNDPK